MGETVFMSDPTLSCNPTCRHGPSIDSAVNIPIDPALGGPILDPALTGKDENEGMQDASRLELTTTDTDPTCTNLQSEKSLSQSKQPSVQYDQFHQYPDGPQGDPFALQLPPVFFPIEPEQPILSPKPAKRNRKRPAREPTCGECHESDHKNGEGQLEKLLSCHECNYKVHPSCILSRKADELYAYPWKCVDCKSCEICQEKGNDARMLFCDYCDKGWHMDCLNPPMQKSPEGSWHCPQCPPVLLDSPKLELESCSLPDVGTSPANGSPSLASSTWSTTGSLNRRTGLKGKEKATCQSDSPDADMEIIAPILAEASLKRKVTKKKFNVSRSVHHSAEEDVLVTPVSPRQSKRTRVQQSPISQSPPKIRLRLPMRKGKGRGNETEEPIKGLFDDILTVEERDTVQTAITNIDEQRFERSRKVAEEKMFPHVVPTLDAAEVASIAGPSRPTRSFIANQLSLLATPTTPIEPSAVSPSVSSSSFLPHEGRNLRIRCIRFGRYDIQTWYDAPFPEEYANVPDGRLWICEFCLKYMKSRFAIERHWLKCKARHPPGDEIYRDGNVSIFEVDGRKNKIYCQNLCLLSKMFLDHKSLFYDVEPFLFYVMTEVDDFGARFVGYFSKEKRSPKDYNVSCIMTLPVRQRQGWGHLLIDFSYLLSRKEKRTGSPEKPLSGLGTLGYKNYWTFSVMRYLKTATGKPQLEDISAATAMTIEDIVVTLKQQGLLTSREVTPPTLRPVPGQSIKFPKGRKNGISRKQIQRSHSANKDKHKNKDAEPSNGPFVPPKEYEITWNQNEVEYYLRRWDAKGYLKLRPEKLQWSPYLVAKEKEQATTMPVKGPSVQSTAVAGNTNEPLMETLIPETQASTVPPLNIFDDEEAEQHEAANSMQKSPWTIEGATQQNAETDSIPPLMAKKVDDLALVTQDGAQLQSSSSLEIITSEEHIQGLQLIHEVERRVSSVQELPSQTIVPAKRQRQGMQSDGEETVASEGYQGNEKEKFGVVDLEVKNEEMYDADADGEGQSP